MFTLIQAPFPVITTTTMLPAADFGDEQHIHASVAYSQSLDATQYSYVKVRDGVHTLSLSFVLTRMKSLELQNFYNLYVDKEWLLTTHDNIKYHGFIKTNPLVLTPVRRSVYSDGTAKSSFEAVTTQFEFEGRLYS